MSDQGSFRQNSFTMMSPTHHAVSRMRCLGVQDDVRRAMDMHAGALQYEARKLMDALEVKAAWYCISGFKSQALHDPSRISTFLSDPSGQTPRILQLRVAKALRSLGNYTDSKLAGFEGKSDQSE